MKEIVLRHTYFIHLLQSKPVVFPLSLLMNNVAKQGDFDRRDLELSLFDGVDNVATMLLVCWRTIYESGRIVLSKITLKDFGGYININRIHSHVPVIH